MILGNVNTFQTPQNFTVENNWVLLCGVLGFVFASLLLCYYFVLLIFNRLVKTALPCRQNLALDNSLNFSISPLIISICKKKKFLHTQQSSSIHLHIGSPSTKFICISSQPLPG